MEQLYIVGVSEVKACGELYACAHIKDFQIQALTHLRPDLKDEPCVAIEGKPPIQWVSSLNERARLLGATIGMTRADLDTIRGIIVLPRSDTQESAAKSLLLECAWSYSPRIEEKHTPDSYFLVIDISGTEKLLGKPEKLVSSLIESISSLAFHCSIAVSSNYHASVIFARNLTGKSNASVIPSHNTQESLAPLPITALDLQKEHYDLFQLWGIHTLGMLAALPQLELIARLGQEAKRLIQLAHGVCEHHFEPVEPAFELVEKLELDTPVTLLDSLLFAIGVLLDQLILRITERLLVIRSISATLTLNDQCLYSRTITPALPSNDRSLWLKLIHLDFASHPPDAPILAVSLRALPGISSSIQGGLFAPQSPEPVRLDITLARIRSIVGEQSVGCLHLLDTHKPDSFQLTEFTVISQPSAHESAPHHNVGKRMVRPPIVINVIMFENRPNSFSFQNTMYTVESAYGPWFNSGGWWNPLLWTIEQWDIVASGYECSSLYCSFIHQREQSRWMISALYD